MQLPLWIGISLSLSFLLKGRLRLLIAMVLGLWFLVPAVGSSTITGVSSGPLAFHAASWLVISIFLTQLLHDPRTLQRTLAKHFFVFLALGLVIAAASLASGTSPAGGGTLLLVDQIIVPVLFFLLLLSESLRGPGLVQFLRALLLGLVALVCIVAGFQWLNHDVMFYSSGYATQYWFNPETDRWMGTLDQPLALSLVVSVAAPLTAGLKNLALKILLLVLMIIGVLISQSRVGLAAVGISVLVVLLFSRHRVWLKATMLVILAGAVIALISSPLIVGVATRLADDTGSAEARALALEYFLTQWSNYAVAGYGIGSSYRVAVMAGLETSFENPILMYSIDFGIFFAALYFGTMLFLVVRNAGRHSYRGITLAGFLAVIVPQTYSSLATRSAAGIVVWTVLAMVVIAGDELLQRRRIEREEAAEARAARHAAAMEQRMVSRQ
jgi:hypothetical protein